MSSNTTGPVKQRRLWRAVDVWLATLQGAVIVALCDGWWAESPAGPLTVYSLIAIYSLPMAVAVGAVAWVLGGVAEIRSRVASQSPWLWPCCSVAWVVWLVAGAQLGVQVLSSIRSATLAGVAMACAVMTLAVVGFVAASSAAQALQRSLGARITTGVGLLLAFGIGVGGLALLIAIGEPSGAGGTMPLFGVLRRQELDLRAVSLLFLWVVVAWLWLELGARRPQTGWRAVLGLGLVLAIAGYGYGRWNDAVAFSVRSSAPLAGKLLGQAWKVLDRDGDGQSALFAGGDCNDGNDYVYSGAQEDPGNGIDEDCSGSDGVVMEVPPGKSPFAAEKEPTPGLAALRKDLNVLLITVDTMRYDLGYMGNPRPLSKNMDALAARSVVYEQAYSLASYTGKSVGPLLIGRYNGETHRTFGHFDKYSTKNVFVQERLQRAGIRTVSVQGYWYFVDEKSGLRRGFDVIDQSAKPAEVDIEGDSTVNSDKISDAALKQLAAVQDQRFFMWVHYVDPHADYVPHKDFDFGHKGRERYDGEIAFVDQQVGRILDFVKQGKLNDNTVIIVTSDHGEAFGEHGLYRHGFEVWEELIRVPLIIYVPGIAPKRERVRRSGVDLVPTILEVFGMPVPGRGAEDFLSGWSLLPDILRKADEEPYMRPIFADLSAGPFNDERQALIEDDIKIITAMGRPVGIYDLAKDPGEKDNLIKDPQRLSDMKAKLADFRSRLKVVQPTR